MAAQKSAGLMAKGAAAPGDENWQRGFKNNPRSDYEQRESPITLAEAGIDKNLAQRAREAEPVDAAGNSPDFWSTAEAIRRKEIAVAKLKELEFEQRSGRLLDAAEVESSWRGQLTDLRRRMLTIPSRCGARLSHLSRTEVSEIDSEIRLALHELSGAKEE
jgi:phage terminase Nu1 subunit (DNA packaging protein)